MQGTECESQGVSVENEELRRRRVHQLMGRPLSESMEIVSAALGDESWRVRREAIEVLVSSNPGVEQVRSLVELLRDDENAGLRNATAEAVMRIGSAAVPALLPYLDDGDHDVRKFVVDALSAIGGEDVLEGLVRALDDPDVNVASAAAEGLGTCGMKSAVKPLLRALEEHQHEFFRFNVLEALGKVGVPAPLPPIIRELASREILRRGVYECLGRIGGDEAAAEILLEGALSPMPSSRYAAIASLSSLIQNLDEPVKGNVVRRISSQLEEGLMDTLSSAFSSGGRVISGHVVRIMSATSRLSCVPILIRALNDEMMMPVALKSLLTIGGPALEVAMARFPEADDEERAAICFLIGKMGVNSDAVNRLVEECLEDPCPEIRMNAAIAVGRLACVDLLSRVTDLLEDDSQSVRDAALETLRLRSACDRGLISEKALNMLGSEVVERRKSASLLFAAIDDTENLSRLIKDVEPDVRESAVRAVGKMRLPGTCSLLVMALVDEVCDVRIAAAESLGACNNCSAVAPLRLALEDQDPWVQAAAIRSLVAIAGQNVLGDVLTLWKKSEPVSQLACLDALQAVNDREALLEIVSSLQGLDSEVLKGVIELLAANAPELLLPVIDNALMHNDWDVRMAALKALELVHPEGMEKLLRRLLEEEQHDLVRQEILSALSNKG